MSVPTTEPTTPRKPATWKKVLAWGTIALGIIFVVEAPSRPTASDSVGYALFGLATLLPGSWWAWCEHQDRQAEARAGEVAKSYRLLTDAERGLLGDPPKPDRMNRHWPVVGIGTLLVFLASMGFITPEDTTAPPAETPEATTTASPNATTAGASATPSAAEPETSNNASVEEWAKSVVGLHAEDPWAAAVTSDMVPPYYAAITGVGLAHGGNLTITAQLDRSGDQEIAESIAAFYRNALSIGQTPEWASTVNYVIIEDGTGTHVVQKRV